MRELYTQDNEKSSKFILSKENILSVLTKLNPSGKCLAAESYFSKKYGKTQYSPMCANKWISGCMLKGNSGACGTCQLKKPVFADESIVRKHMTGSSRFGIYPGLHGKLLQFIVADIDGHLPGQNALADTKVIMRICSDMTIPFMVFSSNSGNGYHVYLFFSEPTEYRKAKGLMDLITERCPGLSALCCLKPTQATDGGTSGGLIALPFHKVAFDTRRSTVPVDSELNPVADDFDGCLEYFLSEYDPILPERLAELIKEYKIDVSEKTESAPVDYELMGRMTGQLSPCIQHIITSNPRTEKTNFNKLVMTIVKFMLAVGFTHDEAISTCHKFLNTYPYSGSYATAQARLDHFTALWRYLSVRHDSHFSCSFILGMGFPGSVFECSKCQLKEPTEQIKGDVTPEEEYIQDPESWPILEDAAYGDNDFLWGFVKTATEHSEADPAAVLMTFLARFSVEVGRNPFRWNGDGQQHANELVAIVGNTASGRKGTSAKPVDRLFRGLGAPDHEIAITTPGPLSSGEGIIFKVRDPVLTYIVNKKTQKGDWVETDPGIKNKRLYIQTEELASAFRAMEREGNTLSTIVRQVFDSGNLAPLTKSSPTKATGAHIGVVGHITGFELDKLAEQNEFYNGLINRFLWVCSCRQKVVPFPKPISDEDLKQMQKNLLDIVKYAQTVSEMTFSVKSKTLWKEEYPRLTEEHGGIMGNILARAVTHVIRLSMLNALLDKKSVIEASHIKAALAIWRYCEQSARYIFESQGRENPIQRKILDALKDGAKTATGISNHFSRNIPAKHIQSVLKALLEQNKITSFAENGKGRPVTKYKILTK